MKRRSSLVLTFALCVGSSLWPHPAAAQDGGPVQTGLNEVALTGNWHISSVSGDADDFWLIFDRPSGVQAFKPDDDEFDFEILESGEWLLRFGIEDSRDTCSGDACQPASVIWIQAVADEAFEVLVRKPDDDEPDDLVIRFERLGPSTDGCRVETVIGISQWVCGTRAISQPFGSGFGELGSFRIVGQTAVWRFSTGVPPGIVDEAWYANDIVSGTTLTIRQITHSSFADVLGSGTIEAFFVTGDTAVWLFRTNVSFVVPAGRYAWYANDIRGGTYLSIRQVTQRAFGAPLGTAVNAFYVTGTTAVWRYENRPLIDAWFANDILAGSTLTIRQLTQNFAASPYAGQFFDVFFQTMRNRAIWRVIVTTGIGAGTTSETQGFVNCIDTGTDASIVSLTPQSPLNGDIQFFRVVGNTAHWDECTGATCTPRQAQLPTCGAHVVTPAASIGPEGGTATNAGFGSLAQVEVPSGLLAATSDVVIDVLAEGSIFPPPLGFVWENGTRLVDIELQPAPTFPLASPGLTITLPLVNALPAGTPLALFVADPVTGHLVPKLNGAGEQIVGSVDTDRASATFHGIVSLSLFVGLRANSVPVAEAGPDQTVQCCGTPVTLDGSASSDPDGHGLTFTWTGPFGTMDGAVVSAVLPPGSHTVTLTVDDGHGGTSSDSLVITVRDAFAALVEAVAALPDAAFHKPELRFWLLGDLGGVTRTIGRGELARAAIKLQDGIRVEISAWITDYIPSSPSELSRSQLLALCDEAVVALQSQQ